MMSGKLIISYNDAKSRAAKLGGLARIKKHGNPGTIQGRTLGTKNSFLTHKAQGDKSPFVAKKINHPPPSEDLAELVGILLGDGGINLYQITISLHKKDDREYSLYVVDLLYKLFGYKAPLIDYTHRGDVVIRISRKNIIEYLLTMGMQRGNKVDQQVDVPPWIQGNIEFSKRCLRGLIDTDGCLYIDRHKGNNKLYEYMGLNFTNHSLPLLHFVKKTLGKLGYHPTQSSEFSIFLRREKEIEDYMQKVGSSNEKIIRKFKKFTENKRKSTKEA